MMKNRKGEEAGFTLIELLIVIAILTVLFALTIIAVNPVRQFAQADNTQRRSDINAILNAVYQYAADNRGSLPVFINSTSTQIVGDTTSPTSGGCVLACGAVTPVGCVNLYPTLVPTYLSAIPRDPDQASASTTRYAITRSSSNNRITVTACDAELSETISITR